VAYTSTRVPEMAKCCICTPRRLNLRLRCTYTRSVREMLNIWPELPIIVDEYRFCSQEKAEGSNNIIDALELNDRVSSIRLLSVSISELERVAASKDPFPALTHLMMKWRRSFPISPFGIFRILGTFHPRRWSLAACLSALTRARITFPPLPSNTSTDAYHPPHSHPF
jgi:hypothetical protein